MKKLLSVLIFLIPLNIFAQDEFVKVSEDMELQKIADNIFRTISYLEIEEYGRVPANGLLVETSKGIVIIDTPWNDEQAELLNNYVKNILMDSISAVIVTHSHNDCAGGLGYLQREQIASYGLLMTKDFCELKGIPYPEKTFSDDMELTMGETVFELFYPGGGHAEDNITVWIKDEKVLFAGCLIKSLASRGRGNIEDANLEEWPKSVKRLMDRYPEAKVIVPGHGEPGDRELLYHTDKILGSYD